MRTTKLCCRGVAEACLARGLLVNSVRPKTLRFAPPLVVSEAEVDRALEILDETLAALGVAAAAAEKEIA